MDLIFIVSSLDKERKNDVSIRIMRYGEQKKIPLPVKLCYIEEHTKLPYNLFVLYFKNNVYHVISSLLLQILSNLTR